MRLRRRPRYDTLQNEVRKRGRSWGRWLYLGLVGLFALWLLDIFFGDLVYFRADGLVMRERVVLATQYTASVHQLSVVENGHVRKGQVIAELVSQGVEESLAKLSSDIASLLTQTTQLTTRKRVIDAISPMAKRRLAEAQQAQRLSEGSGTRGLYTVDRRHTLLENVINGATSVAQIDAERRSMNVDLPKLQLAVEAAVQAMNRLKKIYGDGKVRSSVDGVVGHLFVSRGSVVKPGDPLMEIFYGKPYVLAYVPEGALYRLEVGDPVNIDIGFESYSGRISHIYPVTSQLPREFSDTFRSTPRAQVVRIEFDGDTFPSLFARTKVSAGDWPPRWMVRLWYELIGHGEKPATTGATASAER
jgi:multidrug resistance efflux pump